MSPLYLWTWRITCSFRSELRCSSPNKRFATVGTHGRFAVVRRWVLRWGIIFSKGLGDNSLFFSLCQSVLVEERRFLRLLLFFHRGMLGGMLALFLLFWSVKLEWGLGETCRVCIGRTRTCAQLRSERTEDGMRTYCGRVERSVNKVVELWTRVDVMGTK